MSRNPLISGSVVEICEQALIRKLGIAHPVYKSGTRLLQSSGVLSNNKDNYQLLSEQTVKIFAAILCMLAIFHAYSHVI